LHFYNASVFWRDPEGDFLSDDADWQEPYSYVLASAQTQSEVFDELSDAARTLGFDYCAYGLRTPLPLSNPKTFLLNNYPNNGAG
jgi:LuxR family transcriptional regulator